MKKVIYFAPVCEWNDFAAFNVFLSSIKKDFTEIGVVVPFKAASIVSEADFIICLKEEEMSGNNYPDVLEKAGHLGPSLNIDNVVVHKHVRNSSNLFERAYKYIKNNDRFSEHEIRFYEKDEAIYHKSAVDVYKPLFMRLKSFLANGKLIFPSRKTFDEVSIKYSSYFHNNKKTYLLLTRSFSVKAPEENTAALLPELGEVLKGITEGGINVLNIGFPPQKYDIINQCYRELPFESLSQEELICLMYLSDGVLLSGRSGGFAAHVMSNADLFLIHPEWSATNRDINVSVFNDRSKTVASIDLAEDFKNKNINKILSILLAHQKLSKLLFSDEKEVLFIP